MSEEQIDPRRLTNKALFLLVREINKSLTTQIEQEHRHRITADDTIMQHLFGNPADKSDIGVVGELKDALKATKTLLTAMFIVLFTSLLGIIASLIVALSKH